MKVMITKIFLLSLARAGGTTTLQSPFGDDATLPVLRGSKTGFENEQEGNVEGISMLVGEAYAEPVATNWLGQGGAELMKEKHTKEADIHVDEVQDKKASSASLVVPHVYDCPTNIVRYTRECGWASRCDDGHTDTSWEWCGMGRKRVQCHFTEVRRIHGSVVCPNASICGHCPVNFFPTKCMYGGLEYHCYF